MFGIDVRTLERPQMPDRQANKFSVTIHSDDRGVVGCLRALAKLERDQSDPSGDSNDQDWKYDGHRVTFRFAAPRSRAAFLAQAKRLLPSALYHVMATSDDDSTSLR
jgi:hypothetical protein